MLLIHPLTSYDSLVSHSDLNEKAYILRLCPCCDSCFGPMLSHSQHCSTIKQNTSSPLPHASLAGLLTQAAFRINRGMREKRQPSHSCKWGQWVSAVGVRSAAKNKKTQPCNGPEKVEPSSTLDGKQPDITLH